MTESTVQTYTVQIMIAGNLPARPGLIRRVIVGGLAVVAFWWGVFVAVMAMGGV